MNFLKLDDLDAQEVMALLDRADTLRDLWSSHAMPQSLKGKRVGLWFCGQGFRNRIAFEIGARAMGADVSFIPGDLGIQEPLEDVGHYLRHWFDILVVRCREHASLLSLASDFDKCLVNARTSFNHPCEILGDLQYIRRQRGSVEGLKVVFVGETTNLCMSWFEAARVLPIEVLQVGPAGYTLGPDKVELMNKGAQGRIAVSQDMDRAITKDTGLIYTDCWPKGEAGVESKLFLPYQITRGVVERMGPSGLFLPCPPVTRGQELSEDSLSAPACRVYEAKDCLLHAQNALLEYLSAGS